MQLKETFERVKKASKSLALLTDAQRNDILNAVADAIIAQQERILKANAQDLAKMEQSNPLYDRHPDDPAAQLIKEVAPGRDLSEYIQPEKSAFGRGGMHSKYTTASKVSQAGIRVIIANGERENILMDLIENKDKTLHTEFIPCN